MKLGPTPSAGPAADGDTGNTTVPSHKCRDAHSVQRGTEPQTTGARWRGARPAGGWSASTWSHTAPTARGLTLPAPTSAPRKRRPRRRLEGGGARNPWFRSQHQPRPPRIGHHPAGLGSAGSNNTRPGRARAIIVGYPLLLPCVPQRTQKRMEKETKENR